MGLNRIDAKRIVLNINTRHLQLQDPKHLFLIFLFSLCMSVRSIERERERERWRVRSVGEWLSLPTVSSTLNQVPISLRFLHLSSISSQFLQIRFIRHLNLLYSNLHLFFSPNLRSNNPQFSHLILNFLASLIYTSLSVWCLWHSLLLVIFILVFYNVTFLQSTPPFFCNFCWINCLVWIFHRR